MDIDKLRTVLAVAKTSSFSEAAFEVSLSQSSVSKHIKSIETELGIVIFNRSNVDKSVSLTQDGKTFVAYAKEIVELSDSLIQDIRNSKRLTQIPFIVSSIPMPGTFSRSAIIAKMFMLNPRIAVSIVSKPQYQLGTLLQKREVDAAIVRVLVRNNTILPPESMLYDSNFRVEEICENPCVVVVPDTHPFASRKVLNLQDLANEKIIFQRPKDNGFGNSNSFRYKMFEHSCRDAGFEAKILPSVDPKGLQGEVDLDLVRQGQGIMVVHVKMPKRLNGLSVIPLRGLDWGAKTIVVSLKNHKVELIQNLITALKELAEK